LRGKLVDQLARRIPRWCAINRRRPDLRRLCTQALSVTLLLASLAAAAHTGDKGLATITVSGSKVIYSYWLPMASVSPALAEAMHLSQPGISPDFSPVLRAVGEKIHMEADGQSCAPSPGTVTPPSQEGGNIAVLVEFACPASPRQLMLRDDLADIFASGYVTLANIQWPGGSQQFVFQPDAREARIAIAIGASARGARSFFTLGIEHILIGFDHLLFLLALVLRGGNLWSLLKIVTAFTVAHSITLALAVFDVVVLPSRLVEGAIALSIAYVAAENLFLKHAASHRWAVSFLFGLVHGFGFSSVLRELGLPTEGLIWSLLSFNLGVEVGQATAVAAVLPLLIWVRGFKWEPRAVTALSAVVLVVGVALFLERALL
jgi:hypothetical protein